MASSAEIAHAAEEIRALWIETENEAGGPIPEPMPQTGYSGKFIVRVPRSLHRDLTTAAKRQNVSLNAWATALLAERNRAARVYARLERVESLLVESGQSATRRPPEDDREQPHREHARKSAAD